MSDPTVESSDYQDALGVLEKLALSGSGRRTSDATETTEEGDTLPPVSTDGEAPFSLSWSEATLRSLLESLPDALVVISQGGVISLVNARLEEMFGFQRGELIGQPIELLVPESLRKRHVQHRQGYFAAPRSRPMGIGLELLGRRRDGSTFPVEISLSPLETEQGTFATAVIRDISKRKREEAKLRTLVENIPAVTFVAPLDESAPEFYVSPQIEQLLGFTQKEWLEDPVLWHRQLHPDDRERWNLQFAPTCASGVPFRAIYRFIAKDGRVVWVHGSAQLVRDEQGQPVFLQGVAFDITPIKEAEEAVRQLNAELEARVEERTEELARSMAELREKTDELEQFAFVASHDLREPLRTLVNWPQRLAKQYHGKLDDQADDWIKRIINGADRMRRLIDSLSHYSRVLRRDRTFATIDLTAVCKEAFANLQAAIEDSKAEVTAGELPTIQGNQQQMMLLFQNLIANGIKFRDPERPIRVEVGTRRHEEGWLLWVGDNGIGMEERHLKRIFGLGERLHPASRYPGTGFGLAICEKIVSGHGGRIWAESEVGKGSTFYFILPMMGAE